MNLPRRRILIAVTSAQSLRLIEGFPDYLSSTGWEVHVVCSGAVQPISTNWQLHNIPMHREPAPRHDLLSLVRWIALLTRLRPDLVVAGTPKAGLLGMTAAWICRIPARVYMLRGLRLETESGPKRSLLAALERLSGWFSTRIQAVSHSLALEFVSLGLAPKRKVIVLGSGSSNGVHLTENQSHSPRTDVFTIGFVGRVHPDKGILTLLKAYHLAFGSSASARLLVVGGEEPPGFLNQCLRLANISPERITWVGPVSNPEHYISSMDILALPTRREGFPNVVLEAAAHQVPTVASDVTGCRDAINDGTTGILVPADDPTKLAEVFSALERNPTYVEQLGAAARKRVEAEFQRHAVWKATEDFYTSQLKLKRKRL